MLVSDSKRCELVSWGGQRSRPLAILEPREISPAALRRPYLPVGAGRSYGDSGLIANGVAVSSSRLNSLLDLDVSSGLLRCQAGASVAQILARIVPAGWMLPVVPGTSHVTIGGAIANDVHGKNHVSNGTFGHHVRRLWLMTGEGDVCASRMHHPTLFRATIGGLGLTGLITAAEIQLQPLRGGGCILRQVRRVQAAEALLESLEDADHNFEHTAAWVDCSIGRGAVRGYVDCARAPADDGMPAEFAISRAAAVPAWWRHRVISAPTVKLFNRAHLSVQRPMADLRPVPMQRYLFPLDAVHRWNLLYGRAGFLQFQGVLPFVSSAQERVRELRRMLRLIRHAGLGSPLVVIKLFGAHRSAGILSYPRRGVNIAVDLLNRPATTRVYRQLEHIVRDVDGAIYPAKDALMHVETFRGGYPGIDTFLRSKDPLTTSLFARRMQLV